MVLCINRFARAELKATNNIGRASQSAEDIFWQSNPLTITLNKNSKDNNQTKLYGNSITTASKCLIIQNSETHLLDWTETKPFAKLCIYNMYITLKLQTIVHTSLPV